MYFGTIFIKHQDIIMVKVDVLYALRDSLLTPLCQFQLVLHQTWENKFQTNTWMFQK